MKVADFLAEALVRLGVRHVFGVGGANIEDVFAAVQRRRPELRAVLCKHEHGAGTAADAYSRLRGFAAVMVTSGGAAMNLVHSLAEARASGVPVLAIVGEPPRNLQGLGAFQDTSGRDGAVDVLPVFRAVSTWCERVPDAAALPRLLGEACAAATGARPGPAVLLVAKDLQVAELESSSYPSLVSLASPPRLEAVAAMAEGLAAGPVTIIAGSEVARACAREELERLATALGALVAVEPDARDAFDNADPRFLGVAGAMGHPEVADALGRSGCCLLVGARMPLLARLGHEDLLASKPVFSVGRERPFVGAVHVEGELRASLRALTGAVTQQGAARVSPEVERRPSALPGAEFTSASALSAIEPTLAGDGVVLIDAGNTGAQVIHHLRLPRHARSLVAMGMAGMGFTYGAAVGAALGTGKRVTVFSGDGAFFMHGLDVHTAVEHSLPVTYVVFNNASHGMCLVRERVLLGDNAGYNTFHRSHLGAGLRAMFPRLWAADCRSLAELGAALASVRGREGPALIALELSEVEIPPFGPLRRAVGPGVSSVERGVRDD